MVTLLIFSRVPLAKLAILGINILFELKKLERQLLLHDNSVKHIFVTKDNKMLSTFVTQPTHK